MLAAVLDTFNARSNPQRRKGSQAARMNQLERTAWANEPLAAETVPLQYIIFAHIIVDIVAAYCDRAAIRSVVISCSRGILAGI